MFAFYQEEPIIRDICYLFPLALSISSTSSLASVIAILMTAMINANPISAAIPKMSFHHLSLLLVFLVDASYLLGYLVPIILAHIIVDVQQGLLYDFSELLRQLVHVTAMEVVILGQAYL